ncbi:MAG TPA: urease accessory protein UreD [Casimicrobiaceae bacterium]|jgi:urease accessory protein|nr:urease accessory protein UreD [Casimicrobiaceae bacterium]
MSDAADLPLAAAGSTGWVGELSLAYERAGSRTVLSRRAHRGPLVVQKSLYPEGEAICQSIVIHPPAGIVGGDRLALDVAVGAGAQVQLTTPGAAKWYRSAGAAAQQSLAFSVGARAVLEWLPQETIVFNGAIVNLETRVALHDDARFLGWEIYCLGRRLAGEAFGHGRFRQHVVVSRDGRRQWAERAHFAGSAPLLRAPVGLSGNSVFGTFLAAAPHVPDDLVRACREVVCEDGDGGITRLPGLLLARYLGPSPEAARHYFTALWACARPVLAERQAVPPRIWNT